MRSAGGRDASHGDRRWRDLDHGRQAGRSGVPHSAARHRVRCEVCADIAAAPVTAAPRAPCLACAVSADGLYSRGVRCLVILALVAYAGGLARAEPDTEVPASRRLSPRSDAIGASYTVTYRPELSTGDLRLRAAAPLVRGDGYGMALLAGYGATQLDVDLDELHEHLVFHRFEATLGGGAGLAPGWSLRGSLGAAYSSDLRAATWGALQVTSSAMVHRVLGAADAFLAGVIYSSAGELYPVLPAIGYVHQRAGSPLRIDVFLPHHARAEVALGPRLRSALGIEVVGDTWVAQGAAVALRSRRAGGAVFGELQVAVTGLVRLEARVGLSVDRYVLPVMADGSTVEQPLRAAAFVQTAVILVP